MAFLEHVISSDTFEEIRCNAIRYLGWIDASSSIPFLIARISNPTISNYEKARIGTVCAVLEDWENAEKFLNQYCFTIEERFCEACIWYYYKLFNQSSINYYRYVIRNSSNSNIINICAQKLAALGDVETTFPILEQVINSNAKDGKIGSMRALRSIGDEKSIQLIKKMQQDANLIVQKEARNTLENMGIKTKENINE